MEGVEDVVVYAHLCVTSLLLLYRNTRFGFVLRYLCWQQKLLFGNRNSYLNVILNLREGEKRRNKVGEER